jgi:hypothetical protein
MIGTPNHEAIGRYVVAKEDVERLHMQRHNLAAELSRDLKKAQMMFNDTVQVFGHAAFEKKAGELGDINARLEIALVEMDAAADEAKRPRLRRG